MTRRRLLPSLALAASLALGAPASDAEPADAAAIQAVILDQLEAFQADEMDRAFAHASPGIQSIFRTPERFRRLVQQGYPMIWRPERFDVGNLEPAGDALIQTMVFVDRSGQVFEADYRMELVDGTWRIAGVTLRKLPGLSS